MELFANLTHFKDLASFNSIKNVKQALIDTVQKLEIFDVDDINEQLGRGNKDALELLDKHHIPYTLAQRENGYTVKYSYNGTNYTISYYTPQSIGNPEDTTPEAPDSTPGTPSAETPTTETPTTPAKPDNDTSVDEPETDVEVPPETPTEETPEVDETEKNEEAAGVEETEETPTDPRFDYSVVGNLDTPVKDLYNKETLYEDYKFKIAGSGEKRISSGGYDSVLEDLSEMKPQLKSYIKSELEAKGLTYDESIIDKYLNAYISKALSEGFLMDGFYDKLASFSNTHNTENKELTIKDVINAIVEKIEEELTDKPEWEYKLLTSSAQEPFGDWYVTTHEYLLDTADYFLNDDEKKLKEAMLAAERDGWLVAQNKDEAADWIDTYAVRMKALIKSRSGSSLSDSQIDSIIKQAKEETLKNAEPITAIGQYNAGDILKDFKESCESLEQNTLLLLAITQEIAEKLDEV